MPIFQLLDRERGIQRGRTRPYAPGNFITLQKGGQLYGILYPATPELYVKYKLYFAPNSKAFGYIDNPPPPFPLFLIGPALKPQELVPKNIIQIDNPEQVQIALNPVTTQGQITSTFPVQPPPLAKEIQKTQDQPFDPGDGFQRVVSLVPQQLVPTPIEAKEIVIKADEDNIGDVWFNFRQTVQIGDGMRLIAGAGFALHINDLSKVYFIGSSAGDKIQAIYTK
jgi:hypothetical protein